MDFDFEFENTYRKFEDVANSYDEFSEMEWTDFADGFYSAFGRRSGVRDDEYSY